MMFSVNPSPSRRGTAEVIPRLLAPSVGTLGVGVTSPVVLNLATCNLPYSEDPIYFGSLCFTPHASAALPIFETLQGSVDLTFGIIRLRTDFFVTLRLPDAIRPTATLTSSPSLVVEPTSSATCGKQRSRSLCQFTWTKIITPKMQFVPSNTTLTTASKTRTATSTHRRPPEPILFKSTWLIQVKELVTRKALVGDVRLSRSPSLQWLGCKRL